MTRPVQWYSFRSFWGEGKVSALHVFLHGRCPFSRSYWDHMGPSRFSLVLLQPPFLPKPVTPEYRRSKNPAVPTTTQLLHVPNFPCCFASLLSAHVFPRLTTNPPFMCITRSLNFTRQTGLGILIYVTVPLENLNPLTDSGFALFAVLFVYFFHLFWESFWVWGQWRESSCDPT